MPTHRESIMRKYKLDKTKSYSIYQLSKITNVPKGILQKVFNRGVGAAKTNVTSIRLKGTFQKDYNPNIPRSKRLTKEQWGYARVYSFLNKGKTSRTADKDLFEKIKDRLQ